MRKNISVLLVSCLFIANASCSQNLKANRDDFQHNKYKIIDSTYVDKVGSFCKIFINKTDTSMKMIELYADPDRTRLASIYFTKNGIKNGPFEIYAGSPAIGTLGYFIDDKYDGQWLDYNVKGIITQEYYYTKGKKSGKWKYFDDSGVLIKEEVY